MDRNPKKRSRPLDAAEAESVDQFTRMEVELLHDCTAYALKWPESPLGTAIRLSLGQSHTPSTVQKHEMPQEFGRVVPTPLRSGPCESGTVTFDFSALPCGGGAGAGGIAARVIYTLPDEWLRELPFATQGDLIALTVSSEYRAACQAVVDLEASVAAVWSTTPASLRRALSLRQVLARSDAPDWRARDPEHLRGTFADQLFELWVSTRLDGVTPVRPWGRPLVPEFFVTEPEDEYFIPNATPMPTAAGYVTRANPWLGADHHSVSGHLPAISMGRVKELVTARSAHEQWREEWGNVTKTVGSHEHSNTYVTVKGAAARTPIGGLPPTPTVNDEGSEDIDIRIWWTRVLASSICCIGNPPGAMVTTTRTGSVLPSGNRCAEPWWNRLNWRAEPSGDGSLPPQPSAILRERNANPSWCLDDLSLHEAACDACFT